MAKRRVTDMERVKSAAHNIRIAGKAIDRAHQSMLVVLQVMPSNVEGGHPFLVRAHQIKRAIYEVWDDLNQLRQDMGFSHTVPPKGGD